jgi:hypothetical protein
MVEKSSVEQMSGKIQWLTGKNVPACVIGCAMLETMAQIVKHGELPMMTI